MATNQTFAGDVMPSPLAVAAPQDRIEQQNRIEHTAVAASLGWSGWGSPVGLGVLVIAVGVFLVCLHLAGILH
jgi:hypothetical protein